MIRAFGILAVFATADGDVSLGELARRSGNPKSSTHRLVSDLVTAGALERSRSGYRLGLKLFELGNLVPLQRKLRDAALPFLQDLHDITHLTSTLAVRDGKEIVYVEKLVTRGTAVPNSHIGGRMPVHCTALGKAILAFEDQRFVDELLAKGLAKLTQQTISDPTMLRRELADIRQKRVAFDNEESRPGLFCVAAPVFARTSLIGGLAVTGASAADQTQRLGPTVMGVARALSRALGADPYHPSDSGDSLSRR